jgi:hypothetical protein
MRGIVSVAIAIPPLRETHPLLLPSFGSSIQKQNRKSRAVRPRSAAGRSSGHPSFRRGNSQGGRRVLPNVYRVDLIEKSSGSLIGKPK